MNTGHGGLYIKRSAHVDAADAVYKLQQQLTADIEREDSVPDLVYNDYDDEYE